jgi:hypothetical protein
MWNPLSRNRSNKPRPRIASGSFVRTPAALDQKQKRQQPRNRKVTGRPLRPESNARSWSSPRIARTNIQWPTPSFSWQHLKLGSRWGSLAVLGICATLLAYCFATPGFYVQHIRVRGVQYTSLDEIYVNTDLHDKHIFWVNPQETARRVLAALPNLAAVSATITWTGEVELSIQERAPMLLWEQAGQTWWVTADGVLFPKQSDIPLPHISAPNITTPIDPQVALPATLVQGAVTLSKLRPDFVLQYDVQHGLSIVDSGGWQGYFGDGDDMTNRLALYDGIRSNLVARGIVPVYIDVRSGSTAVYQLVPESDMQPETGG